MRIYITIGIIIILGGLFIYFIIRSIIDDRNSDKELKKRLEEDEFIHSNFGNGRLTLEQAEQGLAMIDPSENENGEPFINLDEKIISHEEAVERKFSSLPENLKEKLDKKKLSAIIGLIEKLTFPDHELTEQNLELVYNTIKRYNLDLNKQEIKLIWE
jgi:hypothetical protein